jgi:ribose-phosphate pyrophosphokinase
MPDLSLFALSAASNTFAETIARHLGLPLSRLEEKEFTDGEHEARPLDSVRGRDVYVVQSLHHEPERSIDAKLLRLLFLIATLVDASAERVTAVLPYLCYSRQDQQKAPRDPLMTRHLARLFEAVGTFRVLTMDVHNLAAFQNAYRCRIEHIEACSLFVQHFARELGRVPLAVVSPDAGGIKRAERFRQSLGQALDVTPPLAFMEKHRDDGKLRGTALVGDVAGRTAIIFDDLISSGSTLLRAAQACRKQGATAVIGAATHGVFAPGAEAVIADPVVDRVVVTDSIPPSGLNPDLLQTKLLVLGAAPLLAGAIQAIHDGASLAERIGSSMQR